MDTLGPLFSKCQNYNSGLLFNWPNMTPRVSGSFCDWSLWPDAAADVSQPRMERLIVKSRGSLVLVLLEEERIMATERGQFS